MDISNLHIDWSWGKLSSPIISALSELAKKQFKEGADKVIHGIKEKWGEHKWGVSEEVYRENLLKNISTTKVLGNPKPIEINKIYTDVYVHDKISALRRFPGNLIDENPEVIEQHNDLDRLPAVDIAKNQENIFILGRPGSGKTTFLRHLAILACKGNLASTPIFIPLKDWSDSNQNLISYMGNQFDLCGFPDAEPFVHALLTSGRAVILLDGLDEVGDTNSKRTQAIKEIVNFSNKYRKCQYCLTCRTAATDYSFESFKYLEIADFNQEQQLSFVRQWYCDAPNALERFENGWNNSEQEGLRELGKTPLLLTLLCLAFDQTMHFPLRQVDLYKEALDALLRKWDSSRLISRDQFYKNLSHSRREHLLEHTAAKLYLNSKIVFRRSEIEKEILQYLNNLPEKELSTETDAFTVIKQIEAQHGIIVERARDIYSFSHLTIQEFLTASYIIKNHTATLIGSLASNGMKDPKWREVMLFTAGLLPSAEILLESMIVYLEELRGSDSGVIKFLTAGLCKSHMNKGRARSKIRQYIYGYDPMKLFEKISENASSSTHPALMESETKKIAEHIEWISDFLEIKSKKYNFGIVVDVAKNCSDLIIKQPKMSSALLGGYFVRPENFISYLYGCRLLIECLEVSVTGSRAKYLTHIMSIEKEQVDKVAKAVNYK